MMSLISSGSSRGAAGLNRRSGSMRTRMRCSVTVTASGSWNWKPTARRSLVSSSAWRGAVPSCTWRKPARSTTLMTRGRWPGSTFFRSGNSSNHDLHLFSAGAYGRRAGAAAGAGDPAGVDQLDDPVGDDRPGLLEAAGGRRAHHRNRPVLAAEALLHDAVSHPVLWPFVH